MNKSSKHSHKYLINYPITFEFEFKLLSLSWQREYIYICMHKKGQHNVVFVAVWFGLVCSVLFLLLNFLFLLLWLFAVAVAIAICYLYVLLRAFEMAEKLCEFWHLVKFHAIVSIRIKCPKLFTVKTKKSWYYIILYSTSVHGKAS